MIASGHRICQRRRHWFEGYLWCWSGIAHSALLQPLELWHQRHPAAVSLGGHRAALPFHREPGGRGLLDSSRRNRRLGRINDEVRIILETYADEMNRSGANYQEMFKKIKNELVQIGRASCRERV